MADFELEVVRLFAGGNAQLQLLQSKIDSLVGDRCNPQQPCSEIPLIVEICGDPIPPASLAAHRSSSLVVHQAAGSRGRCPLSIRTGGAEVPVQIDQSAMSY